MSSNSIHNIARFRLEPPDLRIVLQIIKILVSQNCQFSSLYIYIMLPIFFYGKSSMTSYADNTFLNYTFLFHSHVPSHIFARNILNAFFFTSPQSSTTLAIYFAVCGLYLLCHRIRKFKALYKYSTDLHSIKRSDYSGI